jgi:hypothetical protein
MGILRKFINANIERLSGANRHVAGCTVFEYLNQKRVETRFRMVPDVWVPVCFLPELNLQLQCLGDFFFGLLDAGGSFCLCPAADFIHRTLPPDTVVGLFGNNGGAV